ncbi:hypothetical protein [Gracilibacillus saliphilus]|uniref:hypothetical protein n=1 Tax=Gracilibacillus saliphilus TaxID=543890 RepID=UPI0013D75DDF|nr:hypothetical protein [Gracilibacillus saliphilus]
MNDEFLADQADYFHYFIEEVSPDTIIIALILDVNDRSYAPIELKITDQTEIEGKDV